MNIRTCLNLIGLFLIDVCFGCKGMVFGFLAFKIYDSQVNFVFLPDYNDVAVSGVCRKGKRLFLWILFKLYLGKI